METYYAFLLRIWQAGTPEQPVWRASLEDPHTRQVVSFGDLAALCAFLTQQNFSLSPHPAETQPTIPPSQETDQ